jgi:hydroxysqualene synthase
MDGMATLETPSGKSSADENFPVGSWLLPARLRPHVATFYALARTTDDIADNPNLAASEKLARLDAFEQGRPPRRPGVGQKPSDAGKSGRDGGYAQA